MSSNQKPTVGRDVHYYGEGNSPDEPFSGPYAAKVVAVGPAPAEGEPQRVDLAVFFTGERSHAKTGVPQAAEPTKHHWCWPPRV
jgi:hypothetical protein